MIGLNARVASVRTLRWLVLLAASLGACLSVAAIAVPPHIAMALPDARLSGAGSFRWFGMRIYDAELWVGSQGYQPTKAPIALDLHYLHAFDGKRIAQRSIDEIEKLGFGDANQHESWLTAMQACFPDVEDGTHLTGVYLPGTGVRYYRDGKVLCDIKNPQFAEAFFAIWLDPRTSAPSLRAELLGAEHAP